MNGRYIYHLFVTLFFLISLGLVSVFSAVAGEIAGMKNGYYLGIYQYCMDADPRRYTIIITQDSRLSQVHYFSPFCLEMAREYLRRDNYSLAHPGWEWPLE